MTGSVENIQAMSKISDRISTSWPGFGANHTITFRPAYDIPPGGRIVITPQPGIFYITAGFSYAEVDFATSSALAGPFFERSLAASSTPADDGVAVTANTSEGEIAITLNSSAGIAAGSYARLKLGTNATYQETGIAQIINATTTGVYSIQIEAYTADGAMLERGTTMVVMIEPVSMTTRPPKMRANGQPTGVLAYGTTQTIMSLTTNYKANCRYSTASGTPYEMMTDTFAYTDFYFHSILLTGLVNGGIYNYFIRCRDEFGVDDLTDYPISFEVSLQAGEVGEESGTPGPGGGGSGGGGGGGFGNLRGGGTGNLLPYPPVPDLPGVAFSGWAYPSSEVVILKDGQEQGAVAANTNAEFGAFLSDLSQGVYTFGVWANDSDGRRSITHTMTFWLDEGTQTIISDIILPPTISLSGAALQTGQSATISGQSVPGGTVEVWIYPKQGGEPRAADVLIKEALVATNGRYSVSVSANDLGRGIYTIRARAKFTSGAISGFGTIMELSVDTEATAEICAGADLNGDGRVNLTDFSILLYWWGTDDECADQNKDGTVNLTDFSIMMYYWTG